MIKWSGIDFILGQLSKFKTFKEPFKFSGTDFKIFIDLGGTSTIVGDSTTLTLGSLDSFKYYSRDNTSFALGSVDNFTMGYNTDNICTAD